MKTTTNLGLKKIELADSPPDITVQDANWDNIDKHLYTAVKYQKAGGTGTAITLTEVTLEDGFQKTFIVTANNSSAATKINGKNLYKPGGTAAPNLISGKAVTVWYDIAGDCFFIKASAEGDAVAANVLAGKKFSNDNDTGLTGTMVNNGPATAETINLTSNNQEYTVPTGFHSGLRKIKAVITNLAAGVIKAGTTVGGVLGTFTSDATVNAGDMLTGKTGYKNGALITGNIPLIAPDNANAHRLSTQAVAGYLSPDNPSMCYAYLKADNGSYLNGVEWYRSPQPDLLPANILTGKSILGIAGAMPRMVMGTANVINSPSKTFIHNNGQGTVVVSYVEVTGLTFKPKMIIVRPKSPSLVSLEAGVAQGITVYKENVYQAGRQCILHTELNYSGGYYKTSPSFLSDTNYNVYHTNEASIASTTPAYVNSTGFLLPMGSAYGYPVEWIALDVNIGN